MTVSDENVFRIPPPNSISFLWDNGEAILSFVIDGEADQKELIACIRCERATRDEQIGAAIREWAKHYLNQ